MPDYLLQYGVAATIGFPLIGSGTAVYSTTGSGSLSGTNIQVSKDYGAWATSTNTGTAVPGSGWYSLGLTTSELQAKETIVMVAAGTLGTLVERQAILIHTWGNASAMYPGDWPGSLMANHTVGTVTTLINVASANLVQVLGTAATGTQGVPSVNIARWLGTAATGTQGVPSVNVARWLGTAATGTQGFAGVDVLRINGSATAAQSMGYAARGVGSGTVDGTLGAATFSSDLFTSTVDNFYTGAVVVFIAGGLDLQRTDITDYKGATKQATVTPLTAAPTAGQAFVLV